MGIWDKPKKEFLDQLAREFSFEPPREPGFDAVEAIHAMHEGRGKVLFAMGGNFTVATSDTEFTAAAVRKCSLTAHVSIKLNRSHLLTGRTALILPCLGRSEIDRHNGKKQVLSVEDSMGVVSPTQGVLEPCSPALLSEPAIVAGVAKAVLGANRPIDWDAHVADYGLIRDRIEAVIPGFSSYNDRLREGHLLPAERAARPAEVRHPFGQGRVHAPQADPAPRWPPASTSWRPIRSHDQFNTSIYGLDDRYRGVFNGRRVIFLNEEDMKEAKLVQGQLVDLTSHFRGETRQARQFMVAPYPIPRRCAATYYPESNVLVPLSSVADTSNCPTSKSIPIMIEPCQDQGRFEA